MGQFSGKVLEAVYRKVYFSFNYCFIQFFGKYPLNIYLIEL